MSLLCDLVHTIHRPKKDQGWMKHQAKDWRRLCTEKNTTIGLLRNQLREMEGREHGLLERLSKQGRIIESMNDKGSRESSQLAQLKKQLQAAHPGTERVETTPAVVQPLQPETAKDGVAEVDQQLSSQCPREARAQEFHKHPCHKGGALPHAPRVDEYGAALLEQDSVVLVDQETAEIMVSGVGTEAMQAIQIWELLQPAVDVGSGIAGEAGALTADASILAPALEAIAVHCVADYQSYMFAADRENGESDQAGGSMSVDGRSPTAGTEGYVHPCSAVISSADGQADSGDDAVTPLYAGEKTTTMGAAHDGVVEVLGVYPTGQGSWSRSEADEEETTVFVPRDLLCEAVCVKQIQLGKCLQEAVLDQKRECDVIETQSNRRSQMEQLIKQNQELLCCTSALIEREAKVLGTKVMLEQQLADLLTRLKRVEQERDVLQEQLGHYSELSHAIMDLRQENKRLEAAMLQVAEERASREVVVKATEEVREEVMSLKRHIEVLTRSGADEQEARRREVKRRKEAEHVVRALRVRISYLIELLEEVAEAREAWMVETIALKGCMKAMQERQGIHESVESAEAVMAALHQEEHRHESGLLVAGLQVKISGVPVVLSVHDVPSTALLRVTAFEPRKVRLCDVDVPLLSLGHGRREVPLTRGERQALVLRLLSGLKLEKSRQSDKLALVFEEPQKTSESVRGLRSGKVPVMETVEEMLNRAVLGSLARKLVQCPGAAMQDNLYGCDPSSDTAVHPYRFDATRVVTRDGVFGSSALWKLDIAAGDRALGEQVLGGLGMTEFMDGLNQCTDSQLRATVAHKVAELLTTLCSQHVAASEQTSHARLQLIQALSRLHCTESSLNTVQTVAATERLTLRKTVLKYCREVLHAAMVSAEDAGRRRLCGPAAGAEHAVVRLPESAVDDECLHSILSWVNGGAGDSHEQPRHYTRSNMCDGPEPPLRSSYVQVVEGLVLPFNELTDLSARLLSSLIQQTWSLRLVDIRGNYLTAKGIAMLARAVSENTSVRKVHSHYRGLLLEGERPPDVREEKSVHNLHSMKSTQGESLVDEARPLVIDVRDQRRARNYDRLFRDLIGVTRTAPPPQRISGDTMTTQPIQCALESERSRLWRHAGAAQASPNTTSRSNEERFERLRHKVRQGPRRRKDEMP